MSYQWLYTMTHCVFTVHECVHVFFLFQEESDNEEERKEQSDSGEEEEDGELEPGRKRRKTDREVNSVDLCGCVHAWVWMYIH